MNTWTINNHIKHFLTAKLYILSSRDRVLTNKRIGISDMETSVRMIVGKNIIFQILKNESNLLTTI